MALSNAERQRRFREKRNQALRNGAPRRTLARMIYECYVTEPEAYCLTFDDVPAALAEDMLGLLDSEAVGVAMENDADENAIQDFIGGADYCSALRQYKKDCREVKEYNKGKRQHNRKPAPNPPEPPKD